MPFDRREAQRAAGAFLIGLAAILAILWTLSRAEAGWLPQFASSPPEVQAWFKNQHNEQGQWCCDESDGHPFFGYYRLEADGSVSIYDKGKVVKLPPYMVLKGPNPTGHAVWWFTDAGGAHRDYCFAPGTLT